ncbi:MAG: hypothetical protein FD165_2589 [Gammaproteobacteria bacterium]|nr:MAG: hypothetical protein FD165_2589 [Gammaproteobacteria bacterium]TND04064.1 MAG: hypothetical protein FD120_1773 [Gammaproteobacteria bacterium]
MKKSLIAAGVCAMFAVGTANAGNAFGSGVSPGQVKDPGTSATGLSFSFANGKNDPKTNNGSGQTADKTNNGNHLGQINVVPGAQDPTVTNPSSGLDGVVPKP